jgi:hypothetical protein
MLGDLYMDRSIHLYNQTTFLLVIIFILNCQCDNVGRAAYYYTRVAFYLPWQPMCLHESVLQAAHVYTQCLSRRLEDHVVSSPRRQ